MFSLKLILFSAAGVMSAIVITIIMAVLLMFLPQVIKKGYRLTTASYIFAILFVDITMRKKQVRI